MIVKQSKKTSMSLTNFTFIDMYSENADIPLINIKGGKFVDFRDIHFEDIHEMSCIIQVDSSITFGITNLTVLDSSTIAIAMAFT